LVVRSEIDVLTPKTLPEALKLLEDNRERVKIIAGGSDVIVQLRDGIIRTNALLNLSSIQELRFIREVDGRISLGALTTYSEIVNSSTIRGKAWVLAQAAEQIGAEQLQNTATIGGNIGNASPAADSLPPLYALDAAVTVRSVEGRRTLPIEEFYVGYRKTALKSNELIEHIDFKPLSSEDAAAYLKLGLRNANAISIVDVAVVLREKIKDAYSMVRVALGAVAPTIIRASACEAALQGKPLDSKRLREAADLAAREASPIDDIRGSATYRRNVVPSLVYEALCNALHTVS
jgi:CO/xanthine dehydrogenase FAD-binding subunit